MRAVLVVLLAASLERARATAVNAADGQCKGEDCAAKPLDVALFKAAFVGDAKAVKRHLKAGANPDWRFGGKINSIIDARLPSPKGTSLTALHMAAWAGHRKIVRRLLKKGADKDARASDQSTPLIFAAMRNHEGVVKALLKAGANRDVTDDGGMTAEDWAEDQDNARIEKLLAS